MARFTRTAVLIGALVVSAACNYVKTDGSPLAPASAPSDSPAGAMRLSGEQVVARVAARYPERLAAGISHGERIANMEFLRDRIIETGSCSGLLLAWNRKMNGLRSIDAINWRHGVDDINDVVDLALDYDNVDRPLQLHWMVTHGPAGWDPYPFPSCADL